MERQYSFMNDKHLLNLPSIVAVYFIEKADMFRLYVELNLISRRHTMDGRTTSFYLKNDPRSLFICIVQALPKIINMETVKKVF